MYRYWSLAQSLCSLCCCLHSATAQQVVADSTLSTSLKCSLQSLARSHAFEPIGVRPHEISYMQFRATDRSGVSVCAGRTASV
jgi:hypothetical protein